MIDSIASTNIRTLGLQKYDDESSQKRVKFSTGAEDNMNQSFRPEAMSEQELDKLVDSINTSIASVANDVQLQLDRDRNEVVFRIIDTETKELIRQIPSEEVLKISDKLSEIQGILFENEA